MSGKEAQCIGPGSKPRESRFLHMFENNPDTIIASSNINNRSNLTPVSQTNKQCVKKASYQENNTGLYQYIPPKHILQTLCPVDVRTTFPLHTANTWHNISYVAKALTTTAITPSGQRLRLALDENTYEIKHKTTANGADSDEEPDEKSLHLLESQTLNKSPRESPRSPRPVRRLRRRSDYDDDDSDWEWPGDADGSDSETCFSNNSTPRTAVKDTESSETDTQTQIQFSEVANQGMGTNVGHVEIPEQIYDVFVASIIEGALSTALNISSASASNNVNRDQTSEVANKGEVKDVRNLEIPDQTNGFSIVPIESALETALTSSSASGCNNINSDLASKEADVLNGNVKTVLQNDNEALHSMTKSGIGDGNRGHFKESQPDERVDRDDNTMSPKFERNYLNMANDSTNTFSSNDGIANDMKPFDNSVQSQPQNNRPGYSAVPPSNNLFSTCPLCTCGPTCSASGSQFGMSCIVNQSCCAPDVTSTPFMTSMVVGDDGHIYCVNIPIEAFALTPPQQFSPWLEYNESIGAHNNETAYHNTPCESYCLQNRNCIQNAVQSPIPFVEPAAMGYDTIYDNVASTFNDTDVNKKRPYFLDDRRLSDDSVLCKGMNELVDWSRCSPEECFQQQTSTPIESTDNASQEYAQTPYWNLGNEARFAPGQEDCMVENRQLDNANVTMDPDDGPPYPALYITEDGLMTVILREGIFLEMTPDQALRLVNHEKRLVIAINEDGSRTCVLHPCARISQSETTVHAELFRERKVKMMTEEIVFGNETNSYRFDYNCVTELKPASSGSAHKSSASPDVPLFRDLSQDESIDFLAQDYGCYSKEAVARSQGIVERAYFQNQQTHGCKVIINGVKVVQTDSTEVTVYCGPIKFMRMHPAKSVLRLKTQFVEIDIEANWRVKVTRGSHALSVSHQGLVVSNGKIKASIDNRNWFQAFSVPEHRALMLGQPVRKKKDSEADRLRESS